VAVPHRRTLSVVTDVRGRIAASPLLVDGLIAAGLTALSIITLAAGARDIGSYSQSSIALLLLQTVPLVARRVVPVPVFIVTATATLLHAVQAEGSLNTTLGSLIALFTVGEYAERRVSMTAYLILATGMGALIIVRGGIPQALGGLVQTELSVAASWVLGSWARERRTYIGSVEDRALRAEREREARAERAVADERQRIARELHDVVTHHVSVIVIQAGAALRALDRRPLDAREAVQAIDATARLALADMRRMLGILGTGGVTDREEGLEPMPGLDRLGPLIESVRAAGLPVELSIDGQRRALDPGIELSAYRIVQEALTNALKHAEGARATVDVRYEPTALEVRVADHGGRGQTRVGSLDTGGHGIVGMRERVALFGGTLEAGPTEGGFRVVARLPLDGPAPA
jgi:signal transduction histidine kinase